MDGRMFACLHVCIQMDAWKHGSMEAWKDVMYACMHVCRVWRLKKQNTKNKQTTASPDVCLCSPIQLYIDPTTRHGFPEGNPALAAQSLGCRCQPSPLADPTWHPPGTVENVQLVLYIYLKYMAYLSTYI